MNQPPTPEEIERNESESQGLVGLQPGQHFDPVGDARRELEKLKAAQLLNPTLPKGE